jgi:hypothetical protein
MSEATYKKITLNGELHILKFDFNAIAELEEYYGKGIHAVIGEEQMGFNTVRNILWAGMLWKSPNLKPSHVGQWLNEELEGNEDLSMEELFKISLEALFNSKVMKLMNKSTEAKPEKKAAKKEKNQ